MIDKTKIIPTVLSKLQQLPVNHYIDLRTYKRNRSVIIVKKTSEELLIIENGFFQDEMEIPYDKLTKILKGLLKKEFPRSNKIRLYTMGEYKKEESDNISRKIL